MTATKITDEVKTGWIQIVQADNIKILYNLAKSRQEKWIRCLKGDKEWILIDADPARHVEENFIGSPVFVPTFLGVTMQNGWDTNGNPAPAVGNFVAANEIGGGLALRSLGAADNDWVAMHQGGNYPIMVTQSPHLHITGDIVHTAESYMLAGMVGADNLETGDDSAWTKPDDGIWIEYDTDVDNNMRFVTRSGGVETSTSLGAPPSGHSGVNMVVNDAGDEAKLIFRGTVAATHTTHLPTAQLKLLAMVGTRVDLGGVAKDLHLHDLRFIMDRGGIE